MSLVKMFVKLSLAFFYAARLRTSTAQLDNGLPSSKPFLYPGAPSTPYGPEWQAYYEVTETLPNVTWKMPRSYAGSVSVNRVGHEDNSLFFIAYEKVDGSLASKEGERVTDPWVIWLNGGPGSSSLYGLFSENGPIRYSRDIKDILGNGNGTYVKENPDSWHKLADIVFVDQPVGTGYSTVDSTGYVDSEDQMGEDFVQFLTNLVAVFPSLKQRPLYITGESYAGVYIPYIAKTILSKSPRPVNLAKLAIGDGVLGTYAAAEEYSVITILQTYPQLINFNSKIYEYFVEQYNLCGYNITLHYPEAAHYPTLRSPVDRRPEKYSLRLTDTRSRLSKIVAVLKDLDSETLERMKRQSINDPLIPPLTGTLDPNYGCFLLEEVFDRITSYITPWAGSEFDVYRISDALNPQALDDPALYLNIPSVQSALHAPKKTWIQGIKYPFGSTYYYRPGENEYGDISPEPQVFLSDLIKNVPIVFYSGNDDALVGHRGTELAIQNTTFGGIQGFTKWPSTPWKDDEGNFAGIVHQERNVTYVLFYGAGHMVPTNKPKAATTFLRDFVLGSVQTGLVQANGQVVGGESAGFNGVLTASEVFTGRYSIEGTVTWAPDKWNSWNSFFATRTEADVVIETQSSEVKGSSRVGVFEVGSYSLGLISCIFMVSLCLL